MHGSYLLTRDDEAVSVREVGDDGVHSDGRNGSPKLRPRTGLRVEDKDVDPRHMRENQHVRGVRNEVVVRGVEEGGREEDGSHRNSRRNTVAAAGWEVSIGTAWRRLSGSFWGKGVRG